MSQADPDAGVGRLFYEKLKLVLVLMGKDFKGLHGMVRLIVFMFFFLFVFSILIGFASELFVQVGVPSWTGDVLEGDGPGGVEALDVELEADVYIGTAPLTVNVTPRVEHAEGEVKYKWYVDPQDELGEPDSRSSGTFQWTFHDMDMHSIALVVEDERGEVDPERVWFTLIDPMDTNIHTTIVANGTEGGSPLDVAFEAHTVGGLPPYSFLWSFGDDTTSNQRAPTHTFEAEDEQEFRVTVVVTDRTGNMTPETETYIQVRGDEGGEGIPFLEGFSLLDFAYGFCVMVCIIMVPVAFTASYRQELLRGTVRTLVCYPVGPLEITVSKLTFTFIFCLPFALLAFIIPVQGLEKEGGDYIVIFVVTFLLTIITMTIGALASLVSTKVTKRMWFRPHTMAFGAVMLAYVFTERMMGVVGSILSTVTDMDPDWMAETFAPLIAISPYHLGGEMLRASLGATTDVNPAVLVIPVLLLVGLGWMSTKVYPSIFEKE
jgi:PKD repeat protein